MEQEGNAGGSGRSRLDGLIGILQSGTSLGLRRMAARQIGEVVAAHPTEAGGIVKRVRKLLIEEEWETRIAAGHAMASIAEVTPRWVPGGGEGGGVGSRGSLRLETFDLDRVLRQGSILFGSSGDEFGAAAGAGLNSSLAAQREKLKKELGIDDRLGSAEDVLGVKDEDLEISQAPDSIGELRKDRMNVDSIVAEMEVSSSHDGNPGLSNRERNRLKREAKKARSSAAQSKRPRTSKTQFVDDAGQKSGLRPSLAEAVSHPWDLYEEDETQSQSAGWLFSTTCELLKMSLLDQRWEVRHGGAVGLREILKVHAASAGRLSDGDEGSEENMNWLEDLCCRLLCVLALDRFGDYVGEGVVAPVRETAAMTIAASSQVMSVPRVIGLIKALQVMFADDLNNQWEVRHAGLLGIRYVLAVRQDCAEVILPNVLDSILKGLDDSDDDVRAAAGNALLPLSDRITLIMSERVPEIVKSLWDSTLELEDISSSTSVVFELLSTFSSQKVPSGVPCFWLSRDGMSPTEVLVEYAPRLWPFLRHTSANVRKSVAEVLKALMVDSDNDVSWMIRLLPDVMDKVYRNLMLENSSNILNIYKELWARIVNLGERYPESLLDAASINLRRWLDSSSQESRSIAAQMDLGGNAQERTRPTERTRRKDWRGRRPTQTVTEHHTVTVEGPDEWMEMQQTTAWALALLGSRWRANDHRLKAELLSNLASPFSTTRRYAVDILRTLLYLRPQVEPFESVFDVASAEFDGTSGLPFGELGSTAPSMFTDCVVLLDAMEQGFAPSIDASAMRQRCARGLEAVSKGDSSTSSVLQVNLLDAAMKLVTSDFDAWNSGQSSASQMNKKEFDRISAVRLRLLSALGYLSVRKEEVSCRLTASCGSMIVHNPHQHLRETVGPIIKALLNALRKDKSKCFRLQIASAVGLLSKRLAERPSKKPLNLMLKNLAKFLASSKKKLAAAGSDEEKDNATCEFDGVSAAVRSVCSTFGSRIDSEVPFFWEMLEGVRDVKPSAAISKVESIILANVCVASLDQSKSEFMLELLRGCIVSCIGEDKDGREEGRECLAKITLVIPQLAMVLIVREMIPYLADHQSLRVRLGCVEASRAIVNSLGSEMVPYSAFWVIPLMRRAIDQDEGIRLASAEIFGKLVRLIPLDGGMSSVNELSEDLEKEREEARDFLGQLLGERPRLPYHMPVPIGGGIELRKYQQDCLDWLSFLNRYGLHGALCDDMGLGKTLMTLCIIAGDTVTSRGLGRCTPSLVVCPSTLVGHWEGEVERFFGQHLKNIVAYVGAPKKRQILRESYNIQSCDLIISSYDALASDIEHFQSLQWNYLALDEGHVIKNHKTKVARAVRQIQCQHRLLLTGTPIQNSVLELWSIFDFLMPGFLGSERTFKDAFGKPILLSRDPKATDKDRERGMAVMESLHRQVLPFVMRRLKDDVLDELPPKVVQDYYCSMTPLQVQLYEDFVESVVNSNEQPSSKDGSEKSAEKRRHIFQALHYLRQLCSHPRLVLKESHPEYMRVMSELRASGRSLHDVDQCPKLAALQSILTECGIGRASDDGDSGHRALIFAQLKSMLDIVEHDLFKSLMPSVTYFRLDGTVDISKRQPLVTRFNADPTIDCLLLTTQVGGLGLNLTGADTVIFLEHDWNPTKDLQAMDRAHRIGQKRTVNVYRLITKGTLEEKIMGIQKFKTHLANTVVNRDNSSLESMNTSDLLSLFQVDETPTSVGSQRTADMTDVVDSQGRRGGLSSVIEGLGELWEESQYSEEFNLDDFVGSMKG